MSPTTTGASREAVADRLLAVSREHSFDPDVAIDWDQPWEPGKWFLPPRLVTLYGTDLWDTLTTDQQIELSKHQMASTASLGIWFEQILLQLVARIVYDLDPRSAHARYAIVEVADECRHINMFARLIEKAGTPLYGAGRIQHNLGRLMKMTYRPPAALGAILVAEELLDTAQRAMINDESLQPLVREVCRIHVTEEARHVRWAREELARVFPKLGPVQRTMTRIAIARAAQEICARMVHPKIYPAVGLDSRTASKAVRDSEHNRETLRWMGARLVRYFDEIGVIEGRAKQIWRSTGLID